MSYFSDQYQHVAYPPQLEGAGLYKAQLGAIYAIGSHFTTHDDPAVVTMPTGSGKTAVLTMVPFVLRSTRVLVITPSRLVRGQISEDFEQLATLKRIGVLPAETPLPRIKEVVERVTSPEEWAALNEFDVIVSTPQCVSPGHEGVVGPPPGMFDLLLVDEAHHSPADTWRKLLEAFDGIRRVLFTATPFRRDRSEIPGRFIYNYPVLKAFQDGIFGEIAYVPAAAADGQSNDVAIARKAEEVYRADAAAGFDHRLMVRTDRKTRAEELLTIYESETHLRLKVVHSGHTHRHVKQILKQLEEGTLDGIVCVDMMGEGFNFPRLKIAAIHTPHRSLAVTLQFIGRFARTNAANVSNAKFVAVESDIKIEGQQLFRDKAVWAKIVPDLSHGRIAQEIEVREALQAFPAPAADEDLSELSLYSLSPRCHVKIYDVPRDTALSSERIATVLGAIVRYHNLNETGDVAVVITRQLGRPKWAATDDIIDAAHDLFVIYHDREHHLLFISSSRTLDGMYQTLSETITSAAKPLPTSVVSRVIRDIDNKRVFNVGMRNILASNSAESYKIIAGSDTQNVITANDSRRYRPGHVFLSGDEAGERTNVGYSSRSKVWAASQMQIPELVQWCRRLGGKIRRTEAVVTNCGLDYLTHGKVAERLPQDVIFVQWDEDAFEINPPVSVRYVRDDGSPYSGHILNLELVFDRVNSDEHHLRIRIRGTGLNCPVKFSLENFYEADGDDPDRVQVHRGSEGIGLLTYLNEFAPHVFTANGALMKGNEIFEPKERATPIDLSQIVPLTWTNVYIKHEVQGSEKGECVHDFARRELGQGNAEVVIFDHGTGELADFIALTRRGDVMRVTFYHCKGSAEPFPGARVEDVYEVCGQAQKSVPFSSFTDFSRRLHERKASYSFVKGGQAALDDLLEAGRRMRHQFEVVLVQPGISKERLSPAMAECLGATDGHLLSVGAERLTVWASA
jgi:superfamily II DNA or RNA helicase